MSNIRALACITAYFYFVQDGSVAASVDWRVAGKTDRGRNQGVFYQVTWRQKCLLTCFNAADISSRFGKIEGVKILPQRFPNTSLAAFIDFQSEKSAREAQEAKIEIKGCEIRTNYKGRMPRGGGDAKTDQDSSSKRHHSPERSAVGAAEKEHQDRYGHCGCGLTQHLWIDRHASHAHTHTHTHTHIHTPHTHTHTHTTRLLTCMTASLSCAAISK